MEVLPTNRIYCPICNMVTTWHKKLVSLRYREMSFSIVFCSDCNMAVRHPQLSHETLSDYYSGYNCSTGDGMDDIFERMYGISNRRLNYINNVLKRPARMCIEIGPGAGTLLSLLAHQGVTAVGVEADQVAAKWMKDVKHLNIINGFFEQFAQGRQFDVYRRKCDLIVASHVLEHVSRPFEFLTSIKELLDERDGHLYLEVPNLYRPYSDSVTWKSYCDPGHLYYYSPDYLRVLCREAGYEVVALDHTLGAPYFPIMCVLRPVTGRSREMAFNVENNIQRLRQIWLFFRLKHAIYHAPILRVKSVRRALLRAWEAA